MQIFIKTLRKVFNLEVDSSDQIEVVKRKIKIKEGLPPERQTVFFAEKRLEDSCSLASYSIQMNSTLSVVLHRGIHVFIETVTGKTCSLMVESSDIVQTVMSRIQVKEGTPSVLQQLYYEGKELKVGRTLADYNIQKETTLQCVLNPSMRCNIHIVVRTLTAKIIPLDVDNFETVEGLKSRLQDKEGIPPDQQRLVFKGKLLDERRTLAHYGIEKDSTVYLVLSFCGGLHVYINTLNSKA